MMGWGGSFGKSAKAGKAGGTEMEKGKGKDVAEDTGKITHRFV
tara:strand:- start:636 stop:764 length:129 start_codon:yes stop_codon:yes gene_type:complete